MKKIMNDPKQFVPEMMKGIVAANPGKIKYVPEFNLIMRADSPSKNKVSIIQGSGSGHEPAHIMIVGKGMLDAACPGDVFAAPPMGFVVGASKIMNTPKGILHIVNNYTGDRMSFETALEILEADGVEIQTIFVDDDVAVQNSTWTVGRRGVAGNFFVIKAVGAASEEGASLDELVKLGNKVNSLTRTMGMALTGCTPPAKGNPIFTLAEDEIEMGVGIHGEPGRSRQKMASANEIVESMLNAILTDRKPLFDEAGNPKGTADPIFNKGDEVALMVNGLGGTPISEQYLAYGIAHEYVEKKGIKVWRSYVGEYCTSLEMAGISITLCKVDKQLKDLFLAPADIPIRVF